MTRLPEPLQASETITVADERALAAVASRLASVLPARAFVALDGDLGAGKTTFVKGVAAAVGIDPTDVVSPTFGLIHLHRHPEAGAADGQSQLIVHADMYRLTGIDELAETGWDDAIAPPAWVFVEWPQRIAAALPVERIDLAIAITSPMARTLTITGYGPAHAAAVAALRRG